MQNCRDFHLHVTNCRRKYYNERAPNHERCVRVADSRYFVIMGNRASLKHKYFRISQTNNPLYQG